MTKAKNIRPAPPVPPRDLSRAQLSAVALGVLGAMHGLSLSELLRVIEEVRRLAVRSASLDFESPGLQAEAAQLPRMQAAEAAWLRQEAYMEKVRSDPVLRSRLIALNGSRATWPSLEELEAEFGGEFLEQGGGVEGVGDAGHRAAPGTRHE